MVLLIIIPMKNGYFIGNINPTFSGPNPDDAKMQNFMVVADAPPEISECKKRIPDLYTSHIWVCLKIVYPYTQWFCWSLSLLNGYFIGGIPHFQTYPYEVWRGFEINSWNPLTSLFGAIFLPNKLRAFLRILTHRKNHRVMLQRTKLIFRSSHFDPTQILSNLNHVWLWIPTDSDVPFFFCWRHASGV